jgi:hypothetical protein
MEVRPSMSAVRLRFAQFEAFKKGSEFGPLVNTDPAAFVAAFVKAYPKEKTHG